MAKQRILIVEDDSDLAEMLDAYFRTLDYDVTTAAWGAEGIAAAHDHSFHLIMLDIRLPDISGYDVCRQLRAQRRTQDTPIIFLTEKRDRIDKLQGLELGVVDYITKPFDIHEVRLRVRNALQRAQQQSNMNRVTDLPDGALVDEQINGLLYSSTPWSALGFALVGLELFRERYGFVAADDVVRAVALMIRNTLREFKRDDEFIGHLTPEAFIVLTQSELANDIRDRVLMKMLVSREFFYPLKDRETDEGELKLAEAELIDLNAMIIQHDQNGLRDAQEMREKMLEGLHPQGDKNSPT